MALPAELFGVPIVAYVAVYLFGLLIAAITVTALPIIHHRKSQGLWRKTRNGKHVMSVAVVLALMVDFTFIGAIFQMPVALLLAGIVLFPVFTLVIAWRISIILHSFPEYRLAKEAEAAAAQQLAEGQA